MSENADYTWGSARKIEPEAVRRLVLAVDGLVRSEAVARVDVRLGHTIEFSNQPGCHSAEYDAEQAALTKAVAGALSFECANCHRPLYDHCDVHLIPCCPGKCPGRRPSCAATNIHGVRREHR